MTIKQANSDDAGCLSALMLRLAQESPFMMFEVGEVPNEDSLHRRLLTNSTQETIWVEREANLAFGYIAISRSPLSRSNGVGTIVIGVSDNQQGKGVGSALMQTAIEWASRKGLYRLQLQVQVDNKKAIHLYKKFGFEIEGTIKRASKINGLLVDKFLMAKLL